MLLYQEDYFDVIVAGAGIAGIMAALHASADGNRVLILSSSSLFSGSSFYKGTWGLGLIGPENEEDVESLVQNILKVGCGMAKESLVRKLAAGILPAIKELEELGIVLMQAKEQSQPDYIPCFDSKHRSWRGLIFGSAKKVFTAQMKDRKIVTLENTTLFDLVRFEGKVAGVVVYEKGSRFRVFGCGAFVLATGGYGGLFKNHLTTNDVMGYGQYLALQHGATLINMEFMQMMLGYLKPCYQTIFNERTFRYTTLRDINKEDVLKKMTNKEQLLKLRSTYGPFTSRLPAKEIDLAIVKECKKRPGFGIGAYYCQSMQENMPEFIKTYFDWLYEKKHLSPDDEIEIDYFAHAANGGIYIQPDASTGVGGLFACGEVTGGMHGADRIGGLSTANGLVFGIQAGESARIEAGKNKKNGGQAVRNVTYLLEETAWKDISGMRESMQEIMTKSCMVIREKDVLLEALYHLEQMKKSTKLEAVLNGNSIVESRLLLGQLTLSECILRVEELRRESRGSHYREDYQEENTIYNKPIQIHMQEEQIIIG